MPRTAHTRQSPCSRPAVALEDMAVQRPRDQGRRKARGAVKFLFLRIGGADLKTDCQSPAARESLMYSAPRCKIGGEISIIAYICYTYIIHIRYIILLHYIHIVALHIVVYIVVHSISIDTTLYYTHLFKL